MNGPTFDEFLPDLTDAELMALMKDAAKLNDREIIEKCIAIIKARIPDSSQASE